MKTYCIRYFPVSAPSRIDPGNYGMVYIEVQSEGKQSAINQIAEPFQKYTIQISELAELQT